ncbi:hypothetical protein [Paenibacillus sp. YAF4_2]|uniref:hypothetical protein n=1 Tax=Paenibacillus sp. YAF4_2 TaxID=3233085 RepID=UPI003F97EC0A
MALTVECALRQIARLSRKLAKDVPFRKKVEDLIGDNDLTKNQKVIRMRALLKAAGFKSPSRVRFLNDLETGMVVVSYDALDAKLQINTTVSFTFALQPGP